MMNLLKKVFGNENTNYHHLIKEGAIILDVRTELEYSAGNINGSINIPIDLLPGKLHLLKDKNKPIITCCASGMRSASAKRILLSHGYTSVHNAGSWLSLQNKA